MRKRNHDKRHTLRRKSVTELTGKLLHNQVNVEINSFDEMSTIQERKQMQNILKKILGRGSESQKGFTLIELLVVVGIIVALAAVIVPLVVQFSGRGDAGAASRRVGLHPVRD